MQENPHGERLGRLEANLQNLTEMVREQGRKIDELKREQRAMALDIHAAKIGGRWVLGVCLSFGGFLGWIAKWWLS